MSYPTYNTSFKLYVLYDDSIVKSSEDIGLSYGYTYTQYTGYSGYYGSKSTSGFKEIYKAKNLFWDSSIEAGVAVFDVPDTSFSEFKLRFRTFTGSDWKWEKLDGSVYNNRMIRSENAPRKFGIYLIHDSKASIDKYHIGLSYGYTYTQYTGYSGYYGSKSTSGFKEIYKAKNLFWDSSIEAGDAVFDVPDTSFSEFKLRFRTFTGSDWKWEKLDGSVYNNRMIRSENAPRKFGIYLIHDSKASIDKYRQAPLIMSEKKLPLLIRLLNYDPRIAFCIPNFVEKIAKKNSTEEMWKELAIKTLFVVGIYADWSTSQRYTHGFAEIRDAAEKLAKVKYLDLKFNSFKKLKSISSKILRALTGFSESEPGGIPWFHSPGRLFEPISILQKLHEYGKQYHSLSFKSSKGDFSEVIRFIFSAISHNPALSTGINHALVLQQQIYRVLNITIECFMTSPLLHIFSDHLEPFIELHLFEHIIAFETDLRKGEVPTFDGIGAQPDRGLYDDNDDDDDDESSDGEKKGAPSFVTRGMYSMTAPDRIEAKRKADLLFQARIYLYHLIPEHLQKLIIKDDVQLFFEDGQIRSAWVGNHIFQNIFVALGNRMGVYSDDKSTHHDPVSSILELFDLLLPFTQFEVLKPLIEKSISAFVEHKNLSQLLDDPGFVKPLCSAPASNGLFGSKKKGEVNPIDKIFTSFKYNVMLHPLFGILMRIMCDRFREDSNLVKIICISAIDIVRGTKIKSQDQDQIQEIFFNQVFNEFLKNQISADGEERFDIISSPKYLHCLSLCVVIKKTFTRLKDILESPIIRSTHLFGILQRFISLFDDIQERNLSYNDILHLEGIFARSEVENSIYSSDSSSRRKTQDYWSDHQYSGGQNWSSPYWNRGGSHVGSKTTTVKEPLHPLKLMSDLTSISRPYIQREIKKVKEEFGRIDEYSKMIDLYNRVVWKYIDEAQGNGIVDKMSQCRALMFDKPLNQANPENFVKEASVEKEQLIIFYNQIPRERRFSSLPLLEFICFFLEAAKREKIAEKMKEKKPQPPEQGDADIEELEEVDEEPEEIEEKTGAQSLFAALFKVGVPHSLLTEGSEQKKWKNLFKFMEKLQSSKISDEFSLLFFSYYIYYVNKIKNMTFPPRNTTMSRDEEEARRGEIISFEDDCIRYCFPKCGESLSIWYMREQPYILRSIVNAFGVNLPDYLQPLDEMLRLCEQSSQMSQDVPNPNICHTQLLLDKSLSYATTLLRGETVTSSIDQGRGCEDAWKIASYIIDGKDSFIKLCKKAIEKSQENREIFASLMEEITLINITPDALQALIFFSQQNIYDAVQKLHDSLLDVSRFDSAVSTVRRFQTELGAQNAKKGAEIIEHLTIAHQKSLLHALSDSKYLDLRIRNLIFQQTVQILRFENSKFEIRLVKGASAPSRALIPMKESEEEEEEEGRHVKTVAPVSQSNIVSEERLKSAVGDARFQKKSNIQEDIHRMNFINAVQFLERIRTGIEKMYHNGIIDIPPGRDEYVVWEYKYDSWNPVAWKGFKDGKAAQQDGDNEKSSSVESVSFPLSPTSSQSSLQSHFAIKREDYIISDFQRIDEAISKKFEQFQGELHKLRSSSKILSGITGKDIATLRGDKADLGGLQVFHFSAARENVRLTPFIRTLCKNSDVDIAFAQIKEVIYALQGYRAYDKFVASYEAERSHGHVQISRGLHVDLAKPKRRLFTYKTITAPTIILYEDTQMMTMLNRVPFLYQQEKVRMDPSNILFCSSITSYDEIYSFLAHARAHDSLHTILRCEELSNAALSLLSKLIVRDYDDVKLVIFCPMKDKGKFAESTLWYDYFNHLSPLDPDHIKTPTSFIHTSDLPANGKSHNIKFIYGRGDNRLLPFHISGECSFSRLSEDIRDFVTKAKDGVGNGVLWIDIGRINMCLDEENFDGEGIESDIHSYAMERGIRSEKHLQDFLFSILYLKALRVNGSFLYLTDDVTVHVEIQSSRANWLAERLNHLCVEKRHNIQHTFSWKELQISTGSLVASESMVLTSKRYFFALAALATVIKQYQNPMNDCSQICFEPEDIEIIKNFVGGRIPGLEKCAIPIKNITYGVISSIALAAYRYVVFFKSHGVYGYPSMMVDVICREHDIGRELVETFFKDIWKMIAVECKFAGMCGNSQAHQVTRGEYLDECIFSWEQQKRIIPIIENENVRFISHDSYSGISHAIDHIFSKLYTSLRGSSVGQMSCVKDKSDKDLRKKLVEYLVPDSDIVGSVKFLDGEYNITPDNLFKMIQIRLMLCTERLVVLRADSGVGKTSLIQFLIGSLSEIGLLEAEKVQIDPFVKVTLDAGSSIGKLIESVAEANRRADLIWGSILEKEEVALRELDTSPKSGVPEILDFKAHNEKIQGLREKALVILFIDESNASDLIDVVCNMAKNRSIGSVLLHENIGIVIATNPYRHRKPRDSREETDEFISEVSTIYRVHPLPPSLLCRTMDFGELNPKDTREYIYSILHSSKLMQKARKIRDISDYDYKLLVEVVIKAHMFVREKAQRSAWNCSLRDPVRFARVFYTLLAHENIFQLSSRSSGNKITVKKAWCLALMLVYELRLPSITWRSEFQYYISRSNLNYHDYVETVGKELLQRGLSETKTSGVANCAALRENFISILVCVLSRTPLLIMGSPGSSKSLSTELAFSYLKYHAREKGVPILFCLAYQGSESSTSAGVTTFINRAKNFYSRKDVENMECLSVLLFDELGLAHRSPMNPLKALHAPLEPSVEQPVPIFSFIGISNHVPDAAPSSRSLLIFRPHLKVAEMKEIATEIYQTQGDSKISSVFVDILVDTHYHALETAKAVGKSRWVGNRDLFGFVASVAKSQVQDYKTISLCASRCYSGVDERVFAEVQKKLAELMRRNHLSVPTTSQMPYYAPNPRNLLDAIINNVQDTSVIARHLYVQCSTHFITLLAQYIQSRVDPNRRVRIIYGSSLKGDKRNIDEEAEQLERIIDVAKKGDIGILVNIGNLGALFDLLNKNHSKREGVEYCRVSLGTSGNRRVEVKQGARFILIFPEKNEIQQSSLDLRDSVKFEESALLQRLEKVKITGKDADMSILNSFEEPFLKFIANWYPQFHLRSVPSEFFFSCDEFVKKTFLSVLFETQTWYSTQPREPSIANCESFAKNMLLQKFLAILPYRQGNPLDEQKLDELYIDDEDFQTLFEAAHIDSGRYLTATRAACVAITNFLPICIVNVRGREDINMSNMSSHLKRELSSSNECLIEVKCLNSSAVSNKLQLQLELSNYKSELSGIMKAYGMDVQFDAKQISSKVEKSEEEEEEGQFKTPPHEGEKATDGKDEEEDEEEEISLKRPDSKVKFVILVSFTDSHDSQISQTNHLEMFTTTIKNTFGASLGNSVFLVCICESRRNDIFSPQPGALCSFADVDDIVDDQVHIDARNCQLQFNHALRLISVASHQNSLLRCSKYSLIDVEQKKDVKGIDISRDEVRLARRCRAYIGDLAMKVFHHLGEHYHDLMNIHLKEVMFPISIFGNRGSLLQFKRFLMILSDALVLNSLLRCTLWCPLFSYRLLNSDSSSEQSTFFTPNEMFDMWRKIVDSKIDILLKDLNDDSHKKEMVPDELWTTFHRSKKETSMKREKEEEESSKSNKFVACDEILNIALSYVSSSRTIPVVIDLPSHPTSLCVPFAGEFTQLVEHEICKKKPFSETNTDNLFYIPSQLSQKQAISYCSLAIAVSGLPLVPTEDSELNPELEEVVKSMCSKKLFEKKTKKSEDKKDKKDKKEKHKKKDKKDKKKKKEEEPELLLDVIPLSQLLSFLSHLFSPKHRLINQIKVGYVLYHTIKMKFDEKDVDSMLKEVFQPFIEKSSVPRFITWLLKSWFISQLKKDIFVFENRLEFIISICNTVQDSLDGSFVMFLNSLFDWMKYLYSERQDGLIVGIFEHSLDNLHIHSETDSMSHFHRFALRVLAGIPASIRGFGESSSEIQRESFQKQVRCLIFSSCGLCENILTDKSSVDEPTIIQNWFVAIIELMNAAVKTAIDQRSLWLYELISVDILGVAFSMANVAYNPIVTSIFNDWLQFEQKGRYEHTTFSISLISMMYSILRKDSPATRVAIIELMNAAVKTAIDQRSLWLYELISVDILGVAFSMANVAYNPIVTSIFNDWLQFEQKGRYEHTTFSISLISMMYSILRKDSPATRVGRLIDTLSSGYFPLWTRGTWKKRKRSISSESSTLGPIDFNSICRYVKLREDAVSVVTFIKQIISCKTSDITGKYAHCRSIINDELRDLVISEKNIGKSMAWPTIALWCLKTEAAKQFGTFENFLLACLGCDAPMLKNDVLDLLGIPKENQQYIIQKDIEILHSLHYGNEFPIYPRLALILSLHSTNTIDDIIAGLNGNDIKTDDGQNIVKSLRLVLNPNQISFLVRFLQLMKWMKFPVCEGVIRTNPQIGELLRENTQTEVTWRYLVGICCGCFMQVIGKDSVHSNLVSTVEHSTLADLHTTYFPTAWTKSDLFSLTSVIAGDSAATSRSKVSYGSANIIRQCTNCGILISSAGCDAAPSSSECGNRNLALGRGCFKCGLDTRRFARLGDLHSAKLQKLKAEDCGFIEEWDGISIVDESCRSDIVHAAESMPFQFVNIGDRIIHFVWNILLFVKILSLYGTVHDTKPSGCDISNTLFEYYFRISLSSLGLFSKSYSGLDTDKAIILGEVLQDIIFSEAGPLPKTITKKVKLEKELSTMAQNCYAKEAKNRSRIKDTIDGGSLTQFFEGNFDIIPIIFKMDILTVLHSHDLSMAISNDDNCKVKQGNELWFARIQSLVEIFSCSSGSNRGRIYRILDEKLPQPMDVENLFPPLARVPPVRRFEEEEEEEEKGMIRRPTDNMDMQSKSMPWKEEKLLHELLDLVRVIRNHVQNRVDDSQYEPLESLWSETEEHKSNTFLQMIRNDIFSSDNITIRSLFDSIQNDWSFVFPEGETVTCGDRELWFDFQPKTPLYYFLLIDPFEIACNEFQQPHHKCALFFYTQMDNLCLKHEQRCLNFLSPERNEHDLEIVSGLLAPSSAFFKDSLCSIFFTKPLRRVQGQLIFDMAIVQPMFTHLCSSVQKVILDPDSFISLRESGSMHIFTNFLEHFGMDIEQFDFHRDRFGELVEEYDHLVHDGLAPLMHDILNFMKEMISELKDSYFETGKLSIRIMDRDTLQHHHDKLFLISGKRKIDFEDLPDLYLSCIQRVDCADLISYSTPFVRGLDKFSAKASKHAFKEIKSVVSNIEISNSPTLPYKLIFYLKHLIISGQITTMLTSVDFPIKDLIGTFHDFISFEEASYLANIQLKLIVPLIECLQSIL
ncbi:E3 ubiquitin-protein ligase RNF213 like protein [Aduncisulcus paluster]|uniref:E3 ubiquitin-protein ligase RNF213 like protein n=1 Tax=Aduncisulcus paluster TaxID=2918883 RepID=A0ABQ5KHZ1_9EUKA|nr:E3 ubiquitin-protein ligase RNF213 like protein [Aduncisulcus paluster]